MTDINHDATTGIGITSAVINVSYCWCVVLDLDCSAPLLVG